MSLRLDYRFTALAFAVATIALLKLVEPAPVVEGSLCATDRSGHCQTFLTVEGEQRG